MSAHSALDAHVRLAWKTRKFSDGTKIDLRSGADEQGFVVKPNGIFPIPARNLDPVKCRDGRVITPTVLNRQAMSGHAGGHTHPKDREQRPGPQDDGIARYLSRYSKPSYVIAHRGAYAVEFADGTYIIRTLAGRTLSEKTNAKIIKKWLNNKPRPRGRVTPGFVCQ